MSPTCGLSSDANSADVTEAPSDPVVPNRRRTLWQRIGGEGFLVSVTIHVILVLIAAFLIISVTKESAKKDPDSFSTGSGGGNAGDRAKQFQTRSQPKNPKSVAKTPSRPYPRQHNRDPQPATRYPCILKYPGGGEGIRTPGTLRFI